MKFDLDPLPYAEDALEPHISARTIGFHYHKHHAGYLKKLDAALTDEAQRTLSLEEIIRATEGGTFNSAAQVWNHTFYWNSLDPAGNSSPSEALQRQIDSDFGSLTQLKKDLVAIAAGQFGSGWGWLVWNKAEGKLAVVSTTDAETPVTDNNLVPLLTLDVWEHAYYLDHQNNRGGYLQALADNLLNWDFASQNFPG